MCVWLWATCLDGCNRRCVPSGCSTSAQHYCAHFSSATRVVSWVMQACCDVAISAGMCGLVCRVFGWMKGISILLSGSGRNFLNSDGAMIGLGRERYDGDLVRTMVVCCASGDVECFCFAGLLVSWLCPRTNAALALPLQYWRRMSTLRGRVIVAEPRWWALHGGAM